MNTQNIVQVGNLAPHSAILIGTLTSDFYKNNKAFNIFFSARNGFYTPATRLFRINDMWKTAIKITNDGKGEKLYEKNDPEIPPTQKQVKASRFLQSDLL